MKVIITLSVTGGDIPPFMTSVSGILKSLSSIWTLYVEIILIFHHYMLDDYGIVIRSQTCKKNVRSKLEH